MKSVKWVVGILVAAACAGESRAQWIAPPFGLGFGLQRRNFAVGGFVGAPYPPFGPYGIAGLPPPYPYAGLPPRVTYIVPPAPSNSGSRRAFPEEEYDLSGVDLDLVHPDDLLKPRAELERIMEEARQKQLVKAPRKRVAPPADAAPPPPKKVAPPPEKPPEKKPAVPPAPAEKKKLEKPYPRLLQAGTEAFQTQRYGLAAQRFLQATKLEPGNARGFFLLSQAQFALGKYADAVRSIQQGMRLQADWPQAKFQPHLELYKGDDAFDMHLKRLEDVQAAEPKNADYLFLLGHELWFGGRRERSLELFRRARRFAAEPTFIDAFLRAAGPGPVAALLPLSPATNLWTWFPVIPSRAEG